MDAPITLSQDQVIVEKTLQLEGSSWLKIFKTAHKIAPQFGWPMLMVYYFSPQSYEVSDYLQSWQATLHLSLGLLFVACAFGLRLWAKGFKKDEEFVWEGPYLYVRNPVQVAALLAYFGIGISLGMPLLYIGAAILTAWIYMSFTALGVEQELIKKVGPAYLKYQLRIGRWIPSMNPGANSFAQGFSWKRALVAESSSVLWLILFISVIALRNF